MASRPFELVLDSLQPDVKSGKGMQQYAQLQARERLVDQIRQLKAGMELNPMGADPYTQAKVNQWRRAREKQTGRLPLGEQPSGVANVEAF